MQPDTRHRFAMTGQPAATHVRLDVIPDGGLARLRVHGEIDPDALADLRQRWRAALPETARAGRPGCDRLIGAVAGASDAARGGPVTVAACLAR